MKEINPDLSVVKRLLPILFLWLTGFAVDALPEGDNDFFAVEKSGVSARDAARTSTRGGLNLFKHKSPQALKSTWKSGDRFLNLPNRGTPKLNWKQNSGFLRQEMRHGRPIFDSYLKPNGALESTRGFLNAERYLLKSRGWTFNQGMGAWVPPGF